MELATFSTSEQRDYFTYIPHYLLRGLVLQLSFEDLPGFILTCKRFEKLLNNEVLCREICFNWWKTQFPATSLEPTLPIKTTWRWLLRCITNPVQESHLSKIASPCLVNYLYKEKQHLYLGEVSAGGAKQGAGLLFQSRENQLYIGYFSGNIRQGKGKELFPSGDYYEGDWYNDLPNGEGLRVFQAGRYFGHWKDNQRQGFGEFVWSSGSQYRGNWEKDQKEGFGVYKWISGDKYSGKWLAGTYEYGSYSSYFGSQYVGDHNREGKFDGKGYFIHPDGYFWFGTWKNGVPTDVDACLHPNLRKCIADRVCTKSVTKKTCFYGQVLYKCSCLDAPVCKVCAGRCHQGHTFQEVFWTVGRTCCQCKCHA